MSENEDDLGSKEFEPKSSWDYYKGYILWDQTVGISRIFQIKV